MHAMLNIMESISDQNLMGFNFPSTQKNLVSINLLLKQKRHRVSSKIHPLHSAADGLGIRKAESFVPSREETSPVSSMNNLLIIQRLFSDNERKKSDIYASSRDFYWLNGWQRSSDSKLLPLLFAMKSF